MALYLWNAIAFLRIGRFSSNLRHFLQGRMKTIAASMKTLSFWFNIAWKWCRFECVCVFLLTVQWKPMNFKVDFLRKDTSRNVWVICHATSIYGFKSRVVTFKPLKRLWTLTLTIFPRNFLWEISRSLKFKILMFSMMMNQHFFPTRENIFPRGIAGLQLLNRFEVIFKLILITIVSCELTNSRNLMKLHN